VKLSEKILTALFVLLAGSIPALPQFVLEHPHGNMKISGRIRAAYNYRFNFAGDDNHQGNRFYLQQARVRFGGSLYEVLEYDVHLEFRSYAEVLEAEDIRLTYKPSAMFSVSVGQFKVPYSRQRVMSTTKLQFQSRPEVVYGFMPGRDIGAMIHLQTLDGVYQFYSGLFTGNGINVKNDDAEGEPLVVARAEFQPLGQLAKTEGDIERSVEPQMLLGGNMAYSEDADYSADKPEYLRTIPGKKLLYGVDATLKHKGFFFTAEIHRADLNPQVGVDFVAGGYVAQAGYYFPHLKLEPCLRYDVFDPSDQIEHNSEKSITYGLNLFPSGHQVKLMLNYSQHLKKDSKDSQGWKEDEMQLLWQILF